MTSDEVRHGKPDAHRDDTYKFDWPVAVSSGLWKIRG